MSKVLLIGNGAREHAVGVALIRSGVELHTHMDRLNPGLAKISKEVSIGSTTDIKKLPNLWGYDYAFIGPEAPLASGVTDFITNRGVPCIGPNQAAAMIETSKSFARIVIDQVIPQANPRFMVVRSIDDLRKFEKQIGIENIVVKPNGLTGGKGVKIFGEHLNSRDELEKYAIDLLTKTGVVVLEEKLNGTEFTVQAFADGGTLEFMPLVRDYKRAFDGDTGPNTGSMGSYSASDHGLEYVSQEDFELAKTIMNATMIGIKKKTGSEFKGILYGQFMKTQEGVKVIEYNARFGDPEAMNVMSILSSSMDEVCQRIIDGNLGKVDFEKSATVCVYIVPEGYPGPDVIKDSPLTIDDSVQSNLYYASVYEKDQQIFTTGSRAIGVLAKGDTVKAAREMAYQDVKRIKGRVRYRSDIAAHL
ncbi:MAG: phosphoribosylamine--glycine ligase [Candidatus Thorarchaeota archaeon]|nr:phosphoribosylamine--glycine ligase [Candidatus Thorarchaeota archaeon]